MTLRPQTVDRLGRTVAEVIGEVNLNVALVEVGQAFVYRQYLSGCDVRVYLDAEFRASRWRHGVWQVPGGIIQTWDFRRSPRGRRIDDGTTPGGRRYRCSVIESYAHPQQLLRKATRIWMEMVKPVNPWAAEHSRQSPHHSSGDRNCKR